VCVCVCACLRACVCECVGVLTFVFVCVHACILVNKHFTISTALRLWHGILEPRTRVVHARVLQDWQFHSPSAWFATAARPRVWSVQGKLHGSLTLLVGKMLVSWKAMWVNCTPCDWTMLQLARARLGVFRRTVVERSHLSPH